MSSQNIIVVFHNKYCVPRFTEQETRVVTSMTRIRTEHGFVDTTNRLSSDPYSNMQNIFLVGERAGKDDEGCFYIAICWHWPLQQELGPFCQLHKSY